MREIKRQFWKEVDQISSTPITDESALIMKAKIDEILDNIYKLGYSTGHAMAIKPREN